MPGPPPKPTALKILHGNPGKRPLNKREPQPRVTVPSPPVWLETEAKREWRRISTELLRLGLLTIVDRAALAGYCQSWARWQQAEKIISEKGMTCETYAVGLDGELYLSKVQRRPEVSISQRERQLMRAFLVGFGLDPSSRSRVSVPAATPALEPLAALLD